MSWLIFVWTTIRLWSPEYVQTTRTYRTYIIEDNALAEAHYARLLERQQAGAGNGESSSRIGGIPLEGHGLGETETQTPNPRNAKKKQQQMVEEWVFFFAN